MIRDPNLRRTRAEIGDIDWRAEILKVARLLDHLALPVTPIPSGILSGGARLAHEPLARAVGEPD